MAQMPPDPKDPKPGIISRKPWIVPLVAAGAQALGSIWSAHSANKQQEKLSNTAHQREVADLKAAGLNPVLSAGGTGASSPSLHEADLSKVVGSALQVRQAKADIDLTVAQTESALSAANESRVRAGDILNSAAAGRLERITTARDLEKLNFQQQKSLLPIALSRAQAELESSMSGSRLVAARAALAELQKSGAGNVSDFEKRIGEAGPAVQFLIQLFKLLGNNDTFMVP